MKKCDNCKKDITRYEWNKNKGLCNCCCIAAIN